MAKKFPAEASIDEQLSSAVDGELASDSARFLLRRIQADAALSERWERYTVIGDCMRRQYAGPQARGLAAAVAERIAAEPEVARQGRPAASGQGLWQRAFKPVAGVAVAASVAVMAVVGLRSQAPVDTVESIAAPVASIPADQVRPVAAAPQTTSIDARLSRYLVRHNEIAPEGGRSGFVSYAHMVSNNAARDATQAHSDRAGQPAFESGAADGSVEDPATDPAINPAADAAREVPVQ